MKILILRHGDAYPVGEKNAAVDKDRTLTVRGKKQSRRAGKLCSRIRVIPDIILTSPYLRAHETAEYYRYAVKRKLDVKKINGLEPPGDVKAVEREIEEANAETVLLVGHEPFLGELLQFFLNGNTGASVSLSKGSLSCLEYEPGEDNSTRFLWSLNPSLIKTMLKLAK